MDYKFAKTKENYEAYSSGSVFYSAPNYPAFPLRLANEIVGRCLAFRLAWGESSPCTLYDPCCGSAYALSTLAYFNWQSIKTIFASDFDEAVLGFARKNLALLELQGMEARIQELARLYEQFGKESHAIALENAQMLKGRLAELSAEHRIDSHVFQADATNQHALQTALGAVKVDMVITDIPYEQHAHWLVESAALVAGLDPVQQVLEALLPVLAPKAVVAIAAIKQTKITHESYQQVGKIKVGKRQVVFLKEQSE